MATTTFGWFSDKERNGYHGGKPITDSAFFGKLRCDVAALRVAVHFLCA